MISHSSNDKISSGENVTRQICLAVLGILRDSGNVAIMQISDTVFHLVPEDGKPIEVTDEEFKEYLALVDLTWHTDMRCYILRT